MSTPPSSINEQQSSVASSPSPAAEDADAQATGSNAVRTRLVDYAPAPLRFAGFWAAVTLPFLHTPLLLSGIDSPSKAAAYAGLVALNVVALVVGHQYNRN